MVMMVVMVMMMMMLTQSLAFKYDNFSRFDSWFIPTTYKIDFSLNMDIKGFKLKKTYIWNETKFW